MRAFLDLFLTFLKIGASTFGGGYAMLPVIERELIRRKGWLTLPEVLDYYTIAQVTPGVIAVNVSTFVGHKRKGALGGLVATLGFVLPGVCLVLAVSLGLRRFADYAVVRHAFAGIRIAVGALVLDTGVKLVRGVFSDPGSVILCAAAFCLSAILGASPVLVIAAAGVAGFFLYRTRPPAPPPEAP
ncbi:MAG: chromate transporter [Treponema sp.]|jgi:chromate transporter|nr:chromate transporter [Treponema sp.]